MRRAVVEADVCLDFDDPPYPAPCGVVADEPSADERASGLGRRTRQLGPFDDAQADGYIDSMRFGMNSPVSRKKNGMSESRKI